MPRCTRAHIHIHICRCICIYTYTNIYIYIYTCVCVCVYASTSFLVDACGGARVFVEAPSLLGSPRKTTHTHTKTKGGNGGVKRK